MKLRVYFDRRVRETLSETAPTLRVAITDALLDLADDPVPPMARPYADMEGAYELVTATFRALYSYSDDLPYVSVWVLHINT